jgi:hypothetical protein
LGWDEIVWCISAKRRAGVFCTLTSTLKFTCWFSGYKDELGVIRRRLGRDTPALEEK